MAEGELPSLCGNDNRRLEEKQELKEGAKLSRVQQRREQEGTERERFEACLAEEQ